METFIQETMLDDISICDQLIEYHNNNMEYKKRKYTMHNNKTAQQDGNWYSPYHFDTLTCMFHDGAGVKRID